MQAADPKNAMQKMQKYAKKNAKKYMQKYAKICKIMQIKPNFCRGSILCTSTSGFHGALGRGGPWRFPYAVIERN